jgi:3,4-dihydroxy 2-butanone 4-phosphate synthase/GTP cyclohydrolase II
MTHGVPSGIELHPVQEASAQHPTVSVRLLTCARLPTDEAEFRLCLYANSADNKEHLALVLGKVEDEPGVLVRVHSECFTGDVLGSRRCDCGEQLRRAMACIAEAGRGMIIYLRQEGRGIGLFNKLLAYNLQDRGFDTVDANLALGHQADERDYHVPAAILQDLGVKSVRLLTNNPHKIQRLRELGVDVLSRVPLEPTVTAENADYLRAKLERMNHWIRVSAGSNGSKPQEAADERRT